MATVQCNAKDNSKRNAIFALFIVSALIVTLGVVFGVYSVVYHVNYAVFGSEIPGFVFAAFVVFLGVRYCRAVQKMSKTLKGSGGPFSWKNFKITGKRKWRAEK